MIRQKGIFAILIIILLVNPSHINSDKEKQSEREAIYSRYLELGKGGHYGWRSSLVKGGYIEPHWMLDGNSFWYVEGPAEETIIYKVDPIANAETELFDVKRLRQLLTSILGHQPPHKGLPFRDFMFMNDEKAVKFTLGNKEYILQLETYTIAQSSTTAEAAKDQWDPRGNEMLSPDGRWVASIKEYNLWLRSTSDGGEVQITDDGSNDYEWSLSRARWSPDSSKLALVREDWRKVPKIPIVHWLKTPEEAEWIHFRERAGLPLRQFELIIIEIHSKRQIRIDTQEESDWIVNPRGWRPDGSELFFSRVDRECKRRDLMVANPTLGSSRIILTEEATYYDRYRPSGYFAFLPDGKKFVMTSDENSWENRRNNLYLYDLKGNLIRQLTKENGLGVSQIVIVDEERGWIYFTAHGHLYRVGFEGKGYKQLTEVQADHNTRFSPSREYFLDTYSTVSQPPVVELRKADGTYLQTLSRANIDILKAELKWIPPEECKLKSADGKRDIWGILLKPYDFNPNKKYPVIDWIGYYPYSFQALAQLGFIIFVNYEEETLDQFKTFTNIRGVNDHVAALKQLAKKRPYMDLSRVGVFGYSGSAPTALAAILQAPDVYHVGVVGATNFIEPYGSSINTTVPTLGLPQNNPEGYKKYSLLPLAGNLKGKLLLVHGTSDETCPFSHIMKMVEALIREGKPFDLLVFPEENHGLDRKSDSFTYFQEAIRCYFVEHLKPEIN